MATFVNKNVHLECLGTIAINIVTAKEKIFVTQSQENASAPRGGQEPDVKQNVRQVTMDQTACCCVNAHRELAATLLMAAVLVPGGEWAQPVRIMAWLLDSPRPTALQKVTRISMQLPRGLSS